MNAVTLHDRVISYVRTFPQWPDSWPHVTPTGRMVYGKWEIGALFKNDSKYYGAFPRGLVARVRALFPEVRSEAHILHLFSGGLPKGRYTRLDSNANPLPGVRPELVGNVYNLAELLATRHRPTPFKLIIADPPYSAADAEKYGTAPLDKPRTMRAIAAAVPAGTQLVWLDLQVPIYRGCEWKRWGDIDIHRSTGHKRRVVTFFERKAS